MKVRDIMTSEGLATATLDTPLAEIAERMRDENVGAIPIVDEDDKLAGIITDRDIVVRAIAEGEDPNECTAEDILSEKLHTINPEADLEAAADLMARHQIRRLPVVEDEIIIGMISLGDIAVKSEEDEAGDVLEDVSEGVRHGGVRSERGGRQTGGSRAESATAGRVRNQSQSQQSIANDIVEVEGEEEPEFQSTGGGQARQRANQQQSARGRQSESARGRQSGELRELSSRSQGSSRSQKQESQRRQKITPVRGAHHGAGHGSKSKRKAS